jgi:hypothetical protein
MYNERTMNGVLTDFDLATLAGNSYQRGMERTGTVPFMALDLLTAEGFSGGISRLYRHDSESFAWVLLWICGRYDNGKEITNPPFQGWAAKTYEQCFNNKASYLCSPRFKATPSYVAYEKAAHKLVKFSRCENIVEQANQSIPIDLSY